MNQGGVSGASPCRFTTVSNRAPSASAASAQRSVPLLQPELVIATSAPKPWATSRIRPSSVAMTILSMPEAACAASQLRWIRVFFIPVAPVSSAKALPG